MAEYVLTPDIKQQPSAFELMEELHRRGFPVEIHLKGQDREWEDIRFSDAGPPAVECLLSFDAAKKNYSVSISQDAPLAAIELQVSLVDTLLQTLGGQADNINTRERFNPGQFALKIKNDHSPSSRSKELFWVGFSWVVVAMALGSYFAVAPAVKPPVVAILVLSSISAVLQTYTHFKH